MRIIDSYATLTGSKISKPYIFESYFPLDSEKYITIQSNTQFDSRNYSYWQDVVDAITPILQKNGISFLQIGVEGDPQLMNVKSIVGKTTINQLAHVIKNSIAHIGPDSLCTHLASHYDKPIVALFSSNHVEVSKPIFGDPQKIKIIDSYSRVGNKKPSFSSVEIPKTINLIKPEEICEAILDILNIEQEEKIESIFFGEKYSNFTINFVPDSQILIDKANGLLLNIRFDLIKDVNQNNIIYAMQNIAKRKSVIFANKPFEIDENLLKQVKSNIELLRFDISNCKNENLEKTLEFIKKFKSCGVKCVIVCKNEIKDEDFASVKLKFLDICAVVKLSKKPSAKDILKNLNKDLTYFKSSSIYYSMGSNFLTKTSFLENKSSQSFIQSLSSVSDLDLLDEDIETLYIFTKYAENQTTK